MRKFRYAIYTSFFSVLLYFGSLPTLGQFALAGSLGPTNIQTSPIGFAWSAYTYYKWDEQVLLGLEGGQQEGKEILGGSLYLRFPFGRTILPMVLGSLGYTIPIKQDNSFWRYGAGIDWKNGKYSSILLYAGQENFENNPNYYGRAGLLLEF